MGIPLISFGLPWIALDLLWISFDFLWASAPSDPQSSACHTLKLRSSPVQHSVCQCRGRCRAIAARPAIVPLGPQKGYSALRFTVTSDPFEVEVTGEKRREFSAYRRSVGPGACPWHAVANLWRPDTSHQSARSFAGELPMRVWGIPCTAMPWRRRPDVRCTASTAPPAGAKGASFYRRGEWGGLLRLELILEGP